MNNTYVHHLIQFVSPQTTHILRRSFSKLLFSACEVTLVITYLLAYCQWRTHRGAGSGVFRTNIS